MRRPSLILLLIAACVAAVVISPVYLAFRRAGRHYDRLNRFDELLNALYYYDDNVGRLPDAVTYDGTGNALYSWRVSLLPFLEAVKNTLDLEASWEAPSNRLFSEYPVLFYCNHYERGSAERIKGVVSVFIGRDTPFQIKSSMRLADVPPDTILLIEAKPNAEHWMAPGDIEIGSGPVKIQHPDDGIIVGFADGEIWHLIGAVPAEILLEFATTAPCRARDRQSSLGLFKKTTRHARAFHAR